MWKEAVVAKFKAPSRHLRGRNEKNHENPQSRWSTSDVVEGPLPLILWSPRVQHQYRTLVLVSSVQFNLVPDFHVVIDSLAKRILG
jgi:hypothetical protein